MIIPQEWASTWLTQLGDQSEAIWGCRDDVSRSPSIVDLLNEEKYSPAAYGAKFSQKDRAVHE